MGDESPARAPSAAEANRRRFDQVADHPEYEDVALKPAEHNALVLLADRIHEIEMLDLGVGAGRTGYTFAPLVRRYVGLDYSPRMVERARRRLGGIAGIELAVGDARDLSRLREAGGGSGFDFVLFSFNGIDSVGDEDRRRILAAVRSVLRADGYFLFSSHSLGALPLSTERPVPAHLRGSRAYRLISPLARLRHARLVRRSNQMVDLAAARERGWAMVRDPAHEFTLDVYYVSPEHQVEQLREAGLALEAIYDMNGETVDASYAGRDPWLDYLCRPAQ